MRKIDAARRGTKVPGNRVRVQSMNGQSATVSSRHTDFSKSSDTLGLADGFLLVNPPTFSNQSDAGGTVARNYQFYKINHLKMRWTPLVGTTTPGVVYLAYFDNPELIHRWTSGLLTYANKLSLAKQSPNGVVAPIWMVQEIAGSLMTRRSKYTVSAELPTSIDEHDQLTHGMFVYVLEGGPPTVPIGTPTLEYGFTAYHLQNRNASGI